MLKQHILPKRFLCLASSIICSGLIVDTALDIYILSGIAQRDFECHVETDNGIATEGKRTASGLRYEFQFCTK